MLLRATHSALQQTCPASPPPAASRRSQTEGARFYSTGRSQSRPRGQWAGFSGRCPEILITGSARRHSRPRSRPTFVSSKPRPLTLPSSGCPRGRWGEGQQAVTFTECPLAPVHWPHPASPHPCSSLTPICLPTRTAPCLGSCSSSIQQTITTECQMLF